MNAGKELESAQEKKPETADRVTNAINLMEVERMRRKGGYVVATAGLSGYAFFVGIKLFGFLVSGIIWGAIITAGIIWDETVRMGVQSLLDVAEPQESPTTVKNAKFAIRDSADYERLPIRWKQLLAEVELNQSEYPPRLVRILGDMTLQDAVRIDRLASHTLGNALLRNKDDDSGHNVRELKYTDFNRMKTIGVLQEGQLGQQITAKPQNDQPATHVLRGTTLAIRVGSLDADTEFAIPLTLLTEEGGLIIGLLKRPTSLAGVCAGVSMFESTKYSTEIWASFDPNENPWREGATVREVSSFCPESLRQAPS